LAKFQSFFRFIRGIQQQNDQKIGASTLRVLVESLEMKWEFINRILMNRSTHVDKPVEERVESIVQMAIDQVQPATSRRVEEVDEHVRVEVQVEVGRSGPDLLANFVLNVPGISEGTQLEDGVVVVAIRHSNPFGNTEYLRAKQNVQQEVEGNFGNA
jgi:hypothetical protein